MITITIRIRCDSIESDRRQRRWGRIAGKNCKPGGNGKKLPQRSTVLKSQVDNLPDADFIVLKREGLPGKTVFRETVRFHFDPIPDPEMFVVVDQVHGSSRSMEKTGLHFSRHQTGILSQE